MATSAELRRTTLAARAIESALGVLDATTSEVAAAPEMTDAAAIHGVRLAYKRVHAVVSLLECVGARESVGSIEDDRGRAARGWFRRVREADDRLREIHRRLSRERRRAVLPAAARALEERAPADLARPLGDLCAFVAVAQDSERPSTGDALAALAFARAALASELGPARDGGDELDRAIVRALARSHARARRAGRTARRTRKARDFHRWRRRLKSFLYQWEALGLADAATFPVAKWRRLAATLGDVQDLDDLRAAVERAPLARREARAISKLVKRRVRKLERRALRRARRALAMPRRAFEKRVGGAVLA